MPKKLSCPGCGRWVADDSAVCEWCGYSLDIQADDGDRDESPLVPLWLMFGAAAGVIGAFVSGGVFAYLEPCGIRVFGDECEKRFGWEIFLGWSGAWSGAWSVGVGIVAASVIAVRNTLRGLSQDEKR